MPAVTQPCHLPRATRQQGAATLIVVMLLFFVVSMVAAYTSRSVIFEQKTGSNLYRATQALEAAEAGLEWAVMLLNSGRIDENCVASTDVSDDTFRQRYLSINGTSGVVTRRLGPTSGVVLTPTCYFDTDEGRWICQCPSDAAPTLTTPADMAAPAFRVRFLAFSGAPGYIRVESVGCTRLQTACLVRAGLGLDNEGRAVVSSLVFMGSQSMALPRAALTARGSVTATQMSIANARVADGGITVHASGTIDTTPPGLTLTTLAGNALSGSTVASDTTLSLPAIGTLFTERDRFFAAMFNLMPGTWVQQPSRVRLNCASGCDTDDVLDAIELNPSAPIWIDGNLALNDSDDLGTATAPVLLVVNGSLTFPASAVPPPTIFGLVMVRPANVVTGWQPTGNGRIVGAAVVDGSVGGSGSVQIEYDGDVLSAVKANAGSFARVPGSWRDW